MRLAYRMSHLSVEQLEDLRADLLHELERAAAHGAERETVTAISFVLGAVARRLERLQGQDGLIPDGTVWQRQRISAEKRPLFSAR